MAYLYPHKPAARPAQTDYILLAFFKAASTIGSPVGVFKTVFTSVLYCEIACGSVSARAVSLSIAALKSLLDFADFTPAIAADHLTNRFSAIPAMLAMTLRTAAGRPRFEKSCCTFCWRSVREASISPSKPGVGDAWYCEISASRSDTPVCTFVIHVE